MANTVIMPRQGQSVESCIITAWQKKKGDTVNVGDILFSYETDKSAFDEPSQFAGTILEVLVSEGDVVPCLDPVCIIGEAGEDISALLPGADAAVKKLRRKTQRKKPSPLKRLQPYPNPPASACSSLPEHVCLPSRPAWI